MGAGSSTPSGGDDDTKHSFLNCTNDYELVIKTSKELEHILETHFQATGKGLHEKITSARTPIQQEQQLIRDMRFLATIRNKLIHERGFNTIPDRLVFQERFLRSTDRLEYLIGEKQRGRGVPVKGTQRQKVQSSTTSSSDGCVIL